MADWKQYAGEMAKTRERVEAWERTLSPGELAEADQLKAALHQALTGEGVPEGLDGSEQ